MPWRFIDIIFVVAAGSLLFCVLTFGARQCHRRHKMRSSDDISDDASQTQADPHVPNVLIMAVSVPPYAEGRLPSAVGSHEEVITLAITDDRFGPQSRAQLPPPLDLTQIVDLRDPYTQGHYYSDPLLAESVATLASRPSTNSLPHPLPMT